MTGYDKIKEYVSTEPLISNDVAFDLIEFINEIVKQEKVGNALEAGASEECISSVVRLLPCPFCGGHANLVIEMGEHYIKCMMCYTTTGWKDNEESAIKAWNTRQ